MSPSPTDSRATRPEFVYTHHWRQGDLIFWDNRVLLHRALANYEMGKHRRVLHRTVVRGFSDVTMMNA